MNPNKFNFGKNDAYGDSWSEISTKEEELKKQLENLQAQKEDIRAYEAFQDAAAFDNLENIKRTNPEFGIDALEQYAETIQGLKELLNEIPVMHESRAGTPEAREYESRRQELQKTITLKERILGKKLIKNNQEFGSRAEIVTDYFNNMFGKDLTADIELPEPESDKAFGPAPAPEQLIGLNGEELEKEAPLQKETPEEKIRRLGEALGWSDEEINKRIDAFNNSNEANHDEDKKVDNPPTSLEEQSYEAEKPLTRREKLKKWGKRILYAAGVLLAIGAGKTVADNMQTDNSTESTIDHVDTNQDKDQVANAQDEYNKFVADGETGAESLTNNGRYDKQNDTYWSQMNLKRNGEDIGNISTFGDKTPEQIMEMHRNGSLEDNLSYQAQFMFMDGLVEKYFGISANEAQDLYSRAQNGDQEAFKKINDGFKKMTAEVDRFEWAGNVPANFSSFFGDMDENGHITMSTAHGLNFEDKMLNMVLKDGTVVSIDGTCTQIILPNGVVIELPQIQQFTPVEKTKTEDPKKDPEDPKKDPEDPKKDPEDPKKDPEDPKSEVKDFSDDAIKGGEHVNLDEGKLLEDQSGKIEEADVETPDGAPDANAGIVSGTDDTTVMSQDELQGQKNQGSGDVIQSDESLRLAQEQATLDRQAEHDKQLNDAEADVDRVVLEDGTVVEFPK